MLGCTFSDQLRERSRDSAVSRVSASLRRIAIHYAPAADRVALGIWTQLFAVLPPSVEVEVAVAVAVAPDFDRLMVKLNEVSVSHLDRFYPVVVGTTIATWSRDRYAALVDDRGEGSILAPPRIEAPFASRVGDARSPYAISRAFYHRDPGVADIVFGGGDLAATSRWIVADGSRERGGERLASDRPARASDPRWPTTWTSSRTACAGCGPPRA